MREAVTVASLFCFLYLDVLLSFFCLDELMRVLTRIIRVFILAEVFFYLEFEN